MKTVTVHRAGDIGGQTVEPCTIVIGESIEDAVNAVPHGPNALNTMAHIFNYEADAIAEALFNHLPQAVRERVMLRLMQRHAGYFIGGPRR